MIRPEEMLKVYHLASIVCKKYTNGYGYREIARILSIKPQCVLYLLRLCCLDDNTKRHSILEQYILSIITRKTEKLDKRITWEIESCFNTVRNLDYNIIKELQELKRPGPEETDKYFDMILLKGYTIAPREKANKLLKKLNELFISKLIPVKAIPFDNNYNIIYFEAEPVIMSLVSELECNINAPIKGHKLLKRILHSQCYKS